MKRSGSDGPNESDNASALKTDALGNIYVFYEFGVNGYPHHEIFFDNDTADLWMYGGDYLAKYDSLGNRLWARPVLRYIDTLSWISYGFAGPAAMEIDSLGFIYLAGASNVHKMIFGTDTISVDSNITSSFVMKIDTAANPVWFRLSRTIPPSNPNLFNAGNATDVSLDPSGNVLVTGLFRRTTIFGSDTLVSQATTNNGPNTYMAKLDNNGNFLWAKAVTGLSSIYGNSICSDNAGNVFVGGQATVPALCDSVSLPVGGFLIKLDPAGNIISTKSLAYSVDKLMFDSLLFVTGKILDSATIDNITYYTTGVTGAFVSQLDTSGTVNWLSTLDGSNSIYFVDGSLRNHNIFIAGYYRGTVTLSNMNMTAIGSLDYLVVKYSYNGQRLCIINGGTPVSDQNISIATDNAGRVYTCGMIPSPINYFGAISAQIHGDVDAFVARIVFNSNCCGALPLNSSNTGYLCKGDSVRLSAPPGLASYHWSNGVTDSAFYTGSAGIYIYYAYDSTGCYYQGNPYTVDVRPDYILNTTPNDSVICSGSSATIYTVSQNNTSNTRLWSTGATPSSISVSTPGQYWVRITNAQSGCVWTDTINMTQAGANSDFTAPACNYDTLVIAPSIQLFNDSIVDIYWVILSDTVHLDTLIYPFSSNYGSHSVKLVVTTAAGCTYSVIHSVEFAPTISITLSGDTLYASQSSVNQWLLNGVPIPGANGAYYVPTQTGNYSVINTFQSQCTDTSNSIYLNPAWIPESWLSSSVTVSPNPGDGIYQVNAGSNVPDFSYVVYNVLGEKIISGEFTTGNNIIIDLSKHPAGLYSLHLTNAQGKSMTLPLMLSK